MRDKELLIRLASTNKAKEKALRLVLDSLFEKYKIEICASESGVSKTPLTDEEAIEGCINRLEQIYKPSSSSMTIYVAMEGLIKKEKFGCFVYGWVAVKMNDSENVYFGCSGKVMLPENIYDECIHGSDLSDIIRKEKHNIENYNELWGTNGILTNGVYTRVDEFITALNCALGCFIENNENTLSKVLINSFKM